MTEKNGVERSRAMNITDELREWWLHKFPVRDKELHKDFTAIADRIDTEHQKAIRELNNLADASVLLPIDADGEYIRVGDVMEWIDIEGEVTLTCEVAAVGVECFFAWDKANVRYAQKSASAYRHHHAPTVEDVLREFGIDWEHESDCEDRAALLKEYASKLKLAEVED